MPHDPFVLLIQCGVSHTLVGVEAVCLRWLLATKQNPLDAFTVLALLALVQFLTFIPTLIKSYLKKHPAADYDPNDPQSSEKLLAGIEFHSAPTDVVDSKQQANRMGLILGTLKACSALARALSISNITAFDFHTLALFEPLSVTLLYTMSWATGPTMLITAIGEGIDVASMLMKREASTKRVVIGILYEMVNNALCILIAGSRELKLDSTKISMFQCGFVLLLGAIRVVIFPEDTAKRWHDISTNGFWVLSLMVLSSTSDAILQRRVTQKHGSLCYRALLPLRVPACILFSAMALNESPHDVWGWVGAAVVAVTVGWFVARGESLANGGPSPFAALWEPVPKHLRTRWWFEKLCFPRQRLRAGSKRGGVQPGGTSIDDSPQSEAEKGPNDSDEEAQMLGDMIPEAHDKPGKAPPRPLRAERDREQGVKGARAKNERNVVEGPRKPRESGPIRATATPAPLPNGQRAKTSRKDPERASRAKQSRSAEAEAPEVTPARRKTRPQKGTGVRTEHVGSKQRAIPKKRQGSSDIPSLGWT
jgi:uncharacterized membrane protein YhaH (DUF805 family)